MTEKGLAESSARKIPAESVLFSSRAPVGYVAIAQNELTTNQGFKSFVLPVGIDSRFVYFYLRHIKPLAESMATGTTFKELSGATAAKLPFLFAPFEEQKRIADKLEKLLARVNKGLEYLNRVPNILKRFRQLVLSAAISGELTSDWRSELATQEWNETDIQSVADVGTGSTPLRSNKSFYANTGSPWVTSAATALPFITKAEQFVTEAAISAHRLKLYPVGTLLVAMYGEGKTRGQVSELAIEATVNQACAAVTVDENKAMKDYVKLVLQANYFEMRELSEGGAQPNLNLSKIKEFVFLLPSLEEQNKIVERVENLFDVVSAIEEKYKAVVVRFEQLTPTILTKAFRGELVPQNKNDEPASVLLERIRMARAIQAAEPKRKSTRRKPAVSKTVKEIVLENLEQMPKGYFSFDDLTREVSADYDSLKDAIFELLSQPNSGLAQVFDAEAKTMRFQRVAK